MSCWDACGRYCDRRPVRAPAPLGAETARPARPERCSERAQAHRLLDPCHTHRMPALGRLCDPTGDHPPPHPSVRYWRSRQGVEASRSADTARCSEVSDGRQRRGGPGYSPLRPLRNSFASHLEPSTCIAACEPCSDTIARARSGSERRRRQTRPTIPHSSRNRRLTESSQPSGISPPGFRSPRANARPAHIHHGVSRNTTVSARSSGTSSVS